jgi:hypothetical protein
MTIAMANNNVCERAVDEKVKSADAQDQGAKSADAVSTSDKKAQMQSRRAIEKRRCWGMNLSWKTFILIILTNININAGMPWTSVAVGKKRKQNIKIPSRCEVRAWKSLNPMRRPNHIWADITSCELTQISTT